MPTTTNLQPRSALPLDFTLTNKDKESVLFSLGGAQSLRLTVSNTSAAVMTLPAAKSGEMPSPANHLFALGFSPGTLLEFDKITLSVEDETKWALHVGENPERDHKRYLYFLSRGEQKLQPTENVSLTLTGVKADDHDASHGTVVALRYRGLSLAGANGKLKGVAAHHLSVIHHYPADLGRLDELIQKTPTTLPGLIEQEGTEKQALVELRDEILPPLTVEIVGGWNLLTQGAETELTLRLRPNLHFLLPGSDLNLELTEKSVVFLYSDDEKLAVKNMSVESGQLKWSPIPTDQLQGAAQGAKLTADQTLTTKDHIELKVKLTADAQPHQTSLRLLCESVCMVRNGNRTNFEDFTLRVPLKVGPHRVVGDTLALSGPLGLSGGGEPAQDAVGNVTGEYALRMFEDDGWNFTVKDDDNSAFRVGPTGAKNAGEMTHFVAKKGGVEIGGNLVTHNYLSIRSSESWNTSNRLEHGDAPNGFIIRSNFPNPAERIILAMDPDELVNEMSNLFSFFGEDTNKAIEHLGIPPVPIAEAVSEVTRLFDAFSKTRDGRKKNIWKANGREEFLLEAQPPERRAEGLNVQRQKSGQPDRTDLFIAEAIGNVGIGTENPTAKLHVQGRIKDETGWVMPAGAIIMWSGEKDKDPPEGWVLCDGRKRFYDKNWKECTEADYKKSKTDLPKEDQGFEVTPPNLQDRFVVGTGPSYASGQYGPNITKGDGRTETTMTLSEQHIPKHSHGVVIKPEDFKKVFDTNGMYARHGQSGHGDHCIDNDGSEPFVKFTGEQLEVDTHPYGGDSSGQTKEFDIRPQFFALCFIMKI